MWMEVSEISNCNTEGDWIQAHICSVIEFEANESIAVTYIAKLILYQVYGYVMEIEDTCWQEVKHT